MSCTVPVKFANDICPLPVLFTSPSEFCSCLFMVDCRILIYRPEYSIKEIGRHGRAAMYIGINGYDLINTTEGCITDPEYSSIVPAVTCCNNKLGWRHGIVRSAEGNLHVS